MFQKQDKMETFAWVLIAFLIIVVIIVVAWVLYKYFNRHKLIDLNEVGGGGHVTDNFSSLYNQLQSLIKTMDGQVNTMTKRFNEMNSGSTCIAGLKEIGLTPLYKQFEEDWTNLKLEATLPVSTVYNNTFETLFSSVETTSETLNAVGKLATKGISAERLFCEFQTVRNFIISGKDPETTLRQIDAIIVKMAKIVREE